MKQEIDALITAALAHATANNLTPEESIGLAAVRLVKRFCAQENRNERTTLPQVIQRMTVRHGALIRAEDEAKSSVLATNAAAVQSAIASANVPE